MENREDHQKKIIQGLNIFWRRKFWFLGTFSLVLIATALLILFLPRSYRSSTLILIEGQRVQKEFAPSMVSESIEGRLSTIRQQILSRFFLEKVMDQLGLYKEAKGTREEIIEMMRKQVQIETAGRDRGVDSFSITFISTDPHIAMDAANQLAELFIQENLKVREQLVEGTTAFIDTQLEDLKEKLKAQENDLHQFKITYNGELPEQLDANLRTLDRLRMEVAGLKATIQPLRLKQQERNHQLADLQKTHQPHHPDLIALKREILDFEEGKTPLSQELRQLTTRERQLESEIRTYERRVENTPQREQALAVLLRDYDNIKKNYQIALDKRLSAQLSENMEKKQMGGQFRILDPAPLPETPYRPDPIKVGLAGILIGLLGGIAMVIVRENLDSSLWLPEELESLIPVPFLSSILDHRKVPSDLRLGGADSTGEKQDAPNDTAIPFTAKPFPFHSAYSHRGTAFKSSQTVSRRRSSKPIRNGGGSGLMALTAPHSNLTEQYRLLFLKVHHALPEGKRVIAITSSIKGEGKTTTISNLAIVAARDFGKRSLLIDADFKNPTVGKYFQMNQQTGLMDVVQRRCSIEKAMVPGPVENLTLLPMGAHLPQRTNEITNMESLEDILSRLRKQYANLSWDDQAGGFPKETPEREPFDYIWIDAPPLLPVFDMTLISEAVEGILFVVGAGEAPRQIITQAAKRLDLSKVIGTVLNRVRLSRIAQTYEYAYYSYVAPRR